VIDEIVDAEVCEVAKAAREVLLKALGQYLLEELAKSMIIILYDYCYHQHRYHQHRYHQHRYHHHHE